MLAKQAETPALHFCKNWSYKKNRKKFVISSKKYNLAQIFKPKKICT